MKFNRKKTMKRHIHIYTLLLTAILLLSSCANDSDPAAVLVCEPPLCALVQ